MSMWYSPSLHVCPLLCVKLFVVPCDDVTISIGCFYEVEEPFLPIPRMTLAASLLLITLPTRCALCLNAVGGSIGSTQQHVNASQEQNGTTSHFVLDRRLSVPFGQRTCGLLFPHAWIAQE